jgi:hypothetical protein
LKQEKIDLPGRHLLETIHYLTEAEVAPTSLSNIVKAYIKTPEDFHATQSLITKALETLTEHKILLLSNGTYRITSDIEQRLLDEMNQYPVQIFKKKQQVISAFKNAAFIKSLAKINDTNTSYDFYITSDNDDELTSPALKQLKLKVKSLYSYGDDRTADIEQIKTQYQNDKDVIWIAPDNSHFKEIDKLLDEIERIKYLEEKYIDPNSDEGPIVRAFQAERSAKENRLKELVEQSLIQGNSIYLYNTAQLDKNNWQTSLNGVQRQVIQNVYSQRLSSQLSDAIAERIIKEGNDQRLHTFFSGQGSDFQFFDKHGTFIGESLKPADLILFKIRNIFVDGATLEKDFEQPPTGYSFGTVITTLAALMRGSKIMAKYNGSEKFSWKDEGVSNVFSAAREFRKASFKAIAKSLTTDQKNNIVKVLQELECETHTGKKTDWNTNDFDLVNSVRELAKRFCDKVDDMKRSNKDFDTLFSNLEVCKDQLGSFTGVVSEANYIDRAEGFLTNTSVYLNAIKEIEKAEKFIRNNLEKLRKWKSFIDGVNDELNKAAKSDNEITTLTEGFNSLYKGEVVKNFKQLQESVQKVKDAYFKLMKAAAENMASKYAQLQKDAEKLIIEINKLPEGLNEESKSKVNQILLYTSQRTSSDIDIEYDVKDKLTRFAFSEMLSFVQLYNSYKTELEIISSGLIRTSQPKSKPGTPSTPTLKIFKVQLPNKKLKVLAYKQWLQQELQKLAGASDDDEIEINN